MNGPYAIEVTLREERICQLTQYFRRTHSIKMAVQQHDNVAAIDTLNRFYKDLYDQELTLKFDDTEVTDMYKAVTDFVRKIVETVGRRDPCLKIEEVISVGSAREGTQICTPCEYDFLLIMKELSCPGAINVIEGCPDNLSYVHVRLDSTRLQKRFKDITKDGYIKSTQAYKHWLYREEDGFREKLETALQGAAIENRSSEILTDSGILKFKTTNIETHGPAFLALLRWQSKRSGDTMDISVDMCPAIRMSENLERLVSPESVTCQSYYEHAQRTGSVLFIPCRRGPTCPDGLCYKVAYTETELLLMAGISEHHKRCYKILKYLINGRPGPSIANRSVISKLYYPFYDYPTAVHSYALKVLIWNHHFQIKCSEQNCISSCMEILFTEIKTILEFKDKGVSHEVRVQSMLPCPFNKHISIWSKPKRPKPQRKPKVVLDKKLVLKERFFALLESLQKVSTTNNYNFEDVEIVTLNNPKRNEKLKHISAHVIMLGYILVLPLI